MAKAGDVVGSKYRLIHPLGIGGMGTVWRAEHLELRQHVAIKLLDARGPKAERAVRRFQREAQIAASIHHRNIVYISDFGIGGGEPYLVMELLAGVPLSERMVVGEPLSVGAFMRLMEEGLQGLAAVHAAGIVHRDMKPENIFLVRQSDGGLFPKLLDFGVSRSTERNQGHTITREGVVMGTPEYVSPEQARGRPADVRSDIYSLGVVMYEALAGRLPFQADNPADLIVAVLNAHPVPLASFRPDLGDRVSQLVSKAMAREPEARFQSADEMRGAIMELLASQPLLEECLLPRRFIMPTVEPTPLEGSGQRDSQLPITLSFGPGADAETLQLPLSSGLRRPRVIAGLAGVAFTAALIFVLSWGGRDSGAPSRAAAAAAPVHRPAPVARKESAGAVASREIVVELFGVPADAEVKLDGRVSASNVLRMLRGSGEHQIEVEGKGREPFRIVHDADRDGRYAVSLPLLPSAQKSPAKVSRARSAVKGGLLRRPDF
jgi:serine/threonine protein kinase